MATILIVGVMCGAVAALLAAARHGDRALEIAAKATASACFVVLGGLRLTAGDPVDTWLLIGLAACAGGDMLLAIDRTFDAGLAAFLAGHLCYLAAFVIAAPMIGWPLLPIAPLAAAALGVGAWLWPRLGRRRIPVALYIVAITAMVWGAMSSSLAHALPWRVAAGALLFYLSDLAVARHRFVKAEFANRALGLPAYYAGQLLIALSI